MALYVNFPPSVRHKSIHYAKYVPYKDYTRLRLKPSRRSFRKKPEGAKSHPYRAFCRRPCFVGFWHLRRRFSPKCLCDKSPSRGNSKEKSAAIYTRPLHFPLSPFHFLGNRLPPPAFHAVGNLACLRGKSAVGLHKELSQKPGCRI